MSFTDQINSSSKCCHLHSSEKCESKNKAYYFQSSCSYRACQCTRLQQTWLLSIRLHNALFARQTWTKYCSYWMMMSGSCGYKVHENGDTLRQFSKNYIGFQSNNASITNCVILHIEHFKFRQPTWIFTIVVLFRLTLCLQDHLIHRFCPFHMSEHLWRRKGLFWHCSKTTCNSLPPWHP